MCASCRVWSLAATLCLCVGLAPTTRAVTPWALLVNTNYVLNVTNYGAVGNNSADNTVAIQNAINAAALGGQTNGLSGGAVRFPAGIYLCGPITMKSCVNVKLDAGAILRMLPLDRYPGSTNNPQDFITGSGLHDLAFTGPGAIDGQGQPWWEAYGADSSVGRPHMIYLLGPTRVLVQNLTLSNSPQYHLDLKNGPRDVVVDGLIVRAPPSQDVPNPSHNTDGMDISGTNILIQNCDISTGDDNYASHDPTFDVLFTNNVFGEGHGLSIGSYLNGGGVSNFTVVNCSFNGTHTGIRIKSDIDRGGPVQNLSYLNLSMTNVDEPIVIYAYYTNSANNGKNPSQATPQNAASMPVFPVSTLTPFFRNIVFSNITATASAGLGYAAGIIWGRTEMPATNILFHRVNLTADNGFNVYNADAVRFVDCTIRSRNGDSAVSVFNAQVVVTNSVVTNSLFTFDGLVTNGYGDDLQLYNAVGAVTATNVLDAVSLTLAASTLTVSNNLRLFPATVINYVLSTNPATVAVRGDLRLGGTNTFTGGAGFTNGTYTLLTYSGTLTGALPVVGAAPTNVTCVFDTNTAGKVSLVVAPVTGSLVTGLYFLQPPGDNLAGALLAPPVTVVATNLAGPVTNANVTLSLASGTGALNGTLSQLTGSGGVATFSNLSLTAAGSKQLQAVAGTTAVLSPAFVISNSLASAGITVVDPLSTAATGTSALISSSATVTPGVKVLIVLLATRGGSAAYADPVSLSWNGQSLTQIGTSASDGVSTFRHAAIYYLYNPVSDGLPHPVTGTGGTGLAFWELKYFTLSGVDVSVVPPPGGVAGGGSGTASLSCVLTNFPVGGLAAVCANWSASASQTITFTGGGGDVTSTSDYPDPGSSGSAVGMGYLANLSAGGTNVFTAACSSANKCAFTTAVFSPLASPPPPTNLVAAATNLVVTLKWNSAAGATGYRLKRSTVSGGPYSILVGDWGNTNYADTNVSSGVTYHYVVTATNSAGESANSAQVSAVPLPSGQRTNIFGVLSGGILTLSWPTDHVGWRLQMQANSLGSNWIEVPGSAATNLIAISLSPTNRSVFYRMVYP